MKKEILDLRFQDVDGAELPYLFFPGEVSGDKMLFVHATGFLPWLWQPIIEKFVPPCNAWAPYICNYRHCDPAKGGLSWETIAGDLSGFCRLQKIDKPLVVGHSMGATSLAIATALYELKPRGMVLIEPIFLPEVFYNTPVSVEDHPMASKAIKRKNHWKTEEKAIAYLKSKALFAGWDKRMFNIYFEHGMQKQKDGSLTLTCRPESEAAIFMGGEKINPWPLLPRIECPVLIIEAEESDTSQFVDVKKAVSLFGRSQYRLVKNAGHLVPMQKPEEIAEIIQEFSERIAVQDNL